MNKYILALMMMVAVPAFAADPKPGDSREAVVEELGRPKGSFVYGHNEILTYERGKLHLTDGKVTFVKLKTDDEVARERADAEAAAKLEAERQKLLFEEGSTERARVLADPEFAKKSPAEKIEFWQRFAKKYPSVSIRRERSEAEAAKSAEDARKAGADAAAAAAKTAQAEAAKPKIPVGVAPGTRWTAP